MYKTIRRQTGLFLLGASSLAFSQEFPNVPQTPGEFLSHVAPEMGRLAIIDILDGHVVTIPEGPGSPQNSDLLIRSWDISDPRNPVVTGFHGDTPHPFQAHGLVKNGYELFVGSFPDSAIILNPLNGAISRERAITTPREIRLTKSGMAHPYSARDFWSYGDVSGNTTLRINGVPLAEWDHVGDTGVIGFANFMGDILIYGSDQERTGVASYDISDPTNPVLLDILNTPEQHPTITRNVFRNGQVETESVDYGIGGYWNEIYGHYLVFARREENPGIQVVDFSDPTDLKLHCEFFVRDPIHGISLDGTENPMYVGFQDEYAFAERYKINIETCELELVFDELGARAEMSQYSRPIGNLLLAGGTSNFRIQPPENPAGLSIWAHQAEPDTRAPFVSHHIPQVNRTNYPITAPISIHIPETLRSETIIPGETLSVTEVGGEQIDINYVLSHTGMLTIYAAEPPGDPLDGWLLDNTTYEVRLAGIEDAVRNAMPEYTFRFSTGSTISGGAVPTPDPTPDPTAIPTPDNTPAPDATPTETPLIAPSPLPTQTPIVIITPEPTPTEVPGPNFAPIINSIETDPELILIDELFTVTVNASDPNGDTLEYQFEFDSIESEWTQSNSMSFSSSTTGTKRLLVRIRDGRASTLASRPILIRAVLVDSFNHSLNSSPVACDADNGLAWAVNPDNDTVSEIAVTDREKASEFNVGDKPQNVAVDSEGNVWVTLRNDDQVRIFRPDGELLDTVIFDYGSSPYGIVMSPSKETAYVSLYGSGEVARINTETRSFFPNNRFIGLGPTASAMALSEDGRTLLVTRFISDINWGEVWRIDTQDWRLTNTIELFKNFRQDEIDEGSGVPNYLASIVIHPFGERAYVVGKKDNVDRGLIYGGIDLSNENTVRSMLATIDLTTNEELENEQLDIDNADSPSGLAISPRGDFLFATVQGINEVQVFDLFSSFEQIPVDDESEFPSGAAPQGLCVDAAANVLVSKNFTDRTASLYDITEYEDGSLSPTTINTVEQEVLENEVLLGQQIFYSADERISGVNHYFSCATCHIDGGHDGRTLDFTGRGEGLRNTTSLLGRMGTKFGPVHWSANFDEIQDFENDIRNNFGGDGLIRNQAEFDAAEDPLGLPKAGISPELDALAAYVSSLGKESLPKSPHRQANGANSANAELGRTIFSELGCNECHRGQPYTDGDVHDVGTLREYSGNRLNAELPGIKTPSLLGAFDSAPYLHDGSAAAIEDVFTAIGGTVYQAEDAAIFSGSPGTVNGSDYLRKNGGVGLLGESQTVIQFNVDSPSAGVGYIRFRYAGLLSNTERDVRYVVNGNTDDIQLVTLQHLPALSNGENGSTLETSAMQVALVEGNNTIFMSYPGGSGETTGITIDDLTVSTPDDVANASAHNVAASLSDSDMNNLVQFVLELDTQNAPNDDDEFIIGPVETPIPVPTPSALPAPTAAPEPDATPTGAPAPEPLPTSTNQPINVPTSAPDQGGDGGAGNEGEDDNQATGDDGGGDGLITGANSGGGGSINLFILLLMSGLLLARTRKHFNY